MICDWLSFATFIIVAIGVRYQIHCEEAWLSKAYPEYEEYRKTVRRFFPWFLVAITLA